MVVSCLGIVTLLSTSLLMRESHPDVVQQPGGWLGNLFRLLTFQRQTYTALQTGKLVTSDRAPDVSSGLACSCLESMKAHLFSSILKTLEVLTTLGSFNWQCPSSSCKLLRANLYME